MRILIGTMYCGEPEFEQGKASLRRQSHTQWEQFVIKDLPNKTAHETLYRGFMDRAETCDLFLKLDADMVFEEENKLQDIVSYFAKHSNLDGISIPVQDFFTNSLIHGLHVYRSHVTWPISEEPVFVDPVPVAPNRFRMGIEELAPAVSHCKNPTLYSAFHYGMHRGVKAMESLRRERDPSLNAGYYFESIHRTHQHFQSNPQSTLAMSLLGFEEAIAQGWTSLNVDYQNEFVQQTAGKYAGHSPQEMGTQIHAMQDRSPIGMADRNRLIDLYQANLKLSMSRPSIASRLAQWISKWIPQGLKNRMLKS